MNKAKHPDEDLPRSVSDIQGKLPDAKRLLAQRKIELAAVDLVQARTIVHRAAEKCWQAA